VSRSDQTRVVAHKRRALALIMAAALVGACGDDDSKSPEDDGGHLADGGGKPDAAAPRDASADSGLDAAGRDAGVDAGRDAAVYQQPRTASVPGDDAPTLSKVGFYSDAMRIIFSGSDKNGDISKYTVEFQDAQGNPVSVDTDGDSSTPGVPSFTADVPHDPAFQEFVYSFMPSLETLTLVKKIKITVTDSGNRTAVSQPTAIGPIPVRSQGSNCDPEGFDKCSASSFCAPATNSFTCQNQTNARTAACMTALTLAPAPSASVMGQLNPASYWDAPTGCVGGGGETTGFDDRVVKLVIAAQAAKVTLSTGTMPDFDSVLYKLNSCTENLPACGDSCACSDSDLVLTNVAPGEYYIVVDSFPPLGTSSMFTLTATVE
jgi:hypothetical protein